MFTCKEHKHFGTNPCYKCTVALAEVTEVKHNHCDKGCQYSKDVGMPEHSCAGKCQYDNHPDVVKAEYTGGSVDYYKVDVKNPTTASEPYMAECNDIIEALGTNYAEGNAFKALWRRAAHRTLGKKKAGAKDDGLYDAEKVAFFGARLVEQSKVAK